MDGRDMEHLAAHVDVLPTLADLCGLRRAGNRPLDGASFGAALRGTGPAPRERTLFVHSQRIEHPRVELGTARVASSLAHLIHDRCQQSSTLLFSGLRLVRFVGHDQSASRSMVQQCWADGVSDRIEPMLGSGRKVVQPLSPRS